MIQPLIDRQEQEPLAILPQELRAIYGGDLRFPDARNSRPHVIANFVSTLDGVVSFEIPGQAGGGEISGADESDRFIMGLLRASADAVMVGAGTLREVPSRHLFVAERVFPKGRELWESYRRETLRKAEPPLQVIVSARGTVDLERAVFQTPGVRALIITTAVGRQRLEATGITTSPSTAIRAFEGPDIALAPVLEILRAEFGVRLLLHEGGPVLFGSLAAEGCIDELFLTLAPQLAGRSVEQLRPGLIAGTGFLPETAPWLELVSAKVGGSHLYLRYRWRSSQP